MLVESPQSTKLTPRHCQILSLAPAGIRILVPTLRAHIQPLRYIENSSIVVRIAWILSTFGQRWRPLAGSHGCTPLDTRCSAIWRELRLSLATSASTHRQQRKTHSSDRPLPQAPSIQHVNITHGGSYCSSLKPPKQGMIGNQHFRN